MKEKGFTLAEFLVALGIVGVIAAVTIPAVNRILPDKDKGTVLKIYKTLNEINNEIFNDPSLYMFASSSCAAPHILRCSDLPLDENHQDNNKYNGNNKYPSLLLEHLTLADDVTVSDANCSFTTSDGTDWTIRVNLKSDSGTQVIDYYTIQIDTNRSGRQNCLYSTDCTNPRLFKFVVNSKGQVEAADDDYLTQAFLENPGELNNRSADLRRAAELSASASSSSASSSSSSQ